jgi:hypothetical protein
MSEHVKIEAHQTIVNNLERIQKDICHYGSISITNLKDILDPLTLNSRRKVKFVLDSINDDLHSIEKHASTPPVYNSKLSALFWWHLFYYFELQHIDSLEFLSQEPVCCTKGDYK